MAPRRDDPQALNETLERLLEVPITDLRAALRQATNLVASALRADKVDAFVYAPEQNTLVALGTSDQPLSELQRAQGLDRLPLANGGRTAEVFTTGRTWHSGQVEHDLEELRGLRDTLGVRSAIAVPLDVAGERRGVLVVASQKPDFYDASNVRFAEAVARWIGVVAHQAELVQANAENAAMEGRRAVAEELVMILAHDLRNQLAPITWRLTALRERAAAADGRAADVSELQACLKGLARFGGQISDMLDVARIDQGVFTLDLQAIDLVAMVRDTAETFSTAEHPIEVRPERHVRVVADPARLRQCLENLLSNAVEHSPSGRAVTVLVGVTTNDDTPSACVEVVDQGPGIAPELLPHIFDRFTHGPRRREGLGLGLYLAKQIAASHGGDLTVTSTPGHGAQFKLSIPCTR